MTIWHDYGIRLARILLKCIEKWMPRHDYGVIVRIMPVMITPREKPGGVTAQGYKGHVEITPIMMRPSDVMEATYEMQFTYPDRHVETQRLKAILAFDETRLWDHALEQRRRYYDNVLREDIFRPLYPLEELPWWEDSDEGID